VTVAEAGTERREEETARQRVGAVSETKKWGGRVAGWASDGPERGERALQAPDAGNDETDSEPERVGLGGRKDEHGVVGVPSDV
jgi:hypothetical protein